MCLARQQAESCWCGIQQISVVYAQSAQHLAYAGNITRSLQYYARMLVTVVTNEALDELIWTLC